MSFKLGRLPNDPSKPRLKLSDALQVRAAALPASSDWLSRVTDWPMYLNDQIGDCTCAAVGHMLEQWTAYASTQVEITDDNVLKAYEDVSGYNPKDPNTDQGAVMQDVLNYWRKTGVGGHKIVAFAEVDISNLDECRLSIAEFGTLYLGINFPESAMDQFNNGEPWDVVKGSSIEGGHAINAGWYDTSSNMWKVVTWGKVQPMTQAFFKKYVEEAWVVITQDWIDKNGNAPTGVNTAALGEQFAQLTGQPNPFPPAPTPPPEPTPTPTPEPTPTPTPPEPNDIGKEILATLHKLVNLVERWIGK